MNLNLKILGATALLTAGILFSGCNDSKSYAELLTEENQAINAYLLNRDGPPRRRKFPDRRRRAFL